MSFSGDIKVPFFFLLVISAASVVQGQCDGDVKDLSGKSGTLESPNFKYGSELEKKSNCSWYFNLPTDRCLQLSVVNLALHFQDADDNGRTKCLPSYSLKINGENVGCEPARVTEGGRHQFCLLYKDHRCRATSSCIKRAAEDRVEISYVSDGSPPPPESSTQLAGFQIHYSWLDCEEIYSTMGQTSVFTTQSSNEQSSTVGYTSSVDDDTTGTCALSTVTHTGVTVDKKMPDVTVDASPDLTDEASYWRNWTIALAVLLGLAVCVIIYCLVNRYIPQASPCARRRRRDRYVVNEGFEAENRAGDAEAGAEAGGEAGAEAGAEAGVEAPAEVAEDEL